MLKVFLSLGHNLANWDKWAVSDWITEFDTCAEIAKQTAFIARRPFESVPFILELVPKNLWINERCAWINKKAVWGDYMVELHMNAATPEATGVETFYFAGSRVGQECARRFQMEFTKQTGLKGRWVKEDTATRHGRLWIIRGTTKTLSLLVEMGFLTNKTDRQVIIEKGWRALFEALKKLAW